MSEEGDIVENRVLCILVVLANPFPHLKASKI
jgi:hypothetical protein